MDHRVFLLTLEIAFRALRMTPVSAGNIPPPGEMIVERYFLVWRREHNRPGYKILGRRAGKIFCIRRALGNSYVTSCFDKTGKLFVRNFCLVHPETIDRYSMKRTSIAHLRSFAAHRELASRNPHHPFRSRRWGIDGVDRRSFDYSK